MELTVRRGNDRFVPAGAYRELSARLRSRPELADVPAVVLSAFDRSTRLLPFVLYDWMIFPSGARTIAAALHSAGFSNTRAVFELWNPNFRPSQARLGGRPPELLLISSMQIHAGRAYHAIRDAWKLGPDRPLIIAGGPKAVYEPYHFWPLAGRHGPVGPDVVVTGESYVLLDLLNVVVEHRGRGETMRQAFERARLAGALDSVPGLVYLAPDADLHEPVLVDTGLQRLVQHYDELPHEWVGLRLLEPKHRGPGLSPAPIPDRRLRRHIQIVSVLMTQGCKFNCPYCPIPALNQKSWRFRSPEAIVYEMREIRERFGIKYFFGTDDNFFNHRETVEGILTAMARARCQGKPFGGRVRWATEATQFDTWKNRDLLPVARQAGMHSLWFGIEDLTAELINKGQKPEVTSELFKYLHELKISPMAMIMFHEGQPFYTPGSLYGLFNQVQFLWKAGAVSLQVTTHTPAVGTREFEKTYESGKVLRKVGAYHIPDSKKDGNHVIVAGAEPPWQKQVKLLGGYLCFYNPINLLRGLFVRSKLRRRRTGYQIVGFVATLWTALMETPYLFRLMTGKLVRHQAPPPLQTVPVRLASQAFSRVPEDQRYVKLRHSGDEDDSEHRHVAQAA
jgi:radical SAM superfamily enzyme YgiQ (UPF0313 family)